MQSLVIVGKVGTAYGVKGWVKIYSFTDPIENILHYQPWQLRIDGRWNTVTVKASKPHGAGIVAQLSGCEGREQTRRYVNAEIAIERNQLPALMKDEYYWSDLEKLTVVTTTGVQLGIVDHLIETGANDVLVVKGDKERLIPFILGQVIVNVDIPNKLLKVDWDPEF